MLWLILVLLCSIYVPNTKFLSIPKIEILGSKTRQKLRPLGLYFSSDDEVLDISVQNLERVTLSVQRLWKGPNLCQ